MTSVLARIDQSVDSRCFVTSLSKNACSVETSGAPSPSRIIDLDSPMAPVRPSAVKCDYLFLAEPDSRRPLWVVPLELKGTGLNPGTVTSQLQGGARVAERTLQGVASVRFVAVAAHGRRPHRRSFQKLAEKRIRFRNSRYTIETIPCGASLADAVA